MPIENFNVRKTTEHTGVRSGQLVLSDLPTTTETTTLKRLYVNRKNGIVYQVPTQPVENLVDNNFSGIYSGIYSDIVYQQ